MMEWILVEMFHSYLQREKAIPKEHLRLDKELNFLHLHGIFGIQRQIIVGFIVHMDFPIKFGTIFCDSPVRGRVP